MLTIKLNGIEYPLATNLRVAYTVQNQHNHKSYMTIFSELGKMTVEDQIDVLYAAFTVGNPTETKTYSREMFRAYILDSDDFSASVLMQLLKDVISGILGKDLDTDETEEVAQGSDEKNE